MDWLVGIQNAIDYVEEHITEEIDYEMVARKANCSNSYFQKIFGILSGMSLGEYIRNRQLTLAGNELVNTNKRIIDIAFKYGYESPEGFTRAFTRFHGITPSDAKKGGAILKTFTPISVKAILGGGSIMDRVAIKALNDDYSKKSVVGGTDIESIVLTDVTKENVCETNIEFWNTVGSEFLGVTALPRYGGFMSEDKLQLLGNVDGKKVLEIGCGNGHSLKYIYDKGAAELWGLDISPQQIERTNEFLSSLKIKVNLICSPMESDTDIPKQYFDLIYSIYGIGWTTDLNKTFKNIASYLKKNGIFIFSWSHPVHKCVTIENDKFIFNNSYFDESGYLTKLAGKEFVLSNRKLSTYVNALAESGFVIEKLIEDNDDDILNASKTIFANKARILPVTFIIKARKAFE